jgi:hypothetical protein
MPPRGQFCPSPTKPDQGKPRKKSLDFLGLLRPIRGFSRTYGQSKQEKQEKCFSCA